MTTPTYRLQRTINDYRSRLMQQEAGARVALEDAYSTVLSVIQPALDRLYDAITDKLNAGEKIPLSWLYERVRLENLTLLIQQHIDQFGALALSHTRTLQHLGVDLGLRAALDLLKAITPAGVYWTWGMPSEQAIQRLIGATQAGSPLADLFAGFGSEAARLVKQALITGVTLGENPRQFAPRVRDALNVSRARALTISRTESLRAYRGANQETFKANSDAVKQWRWTCAKQIRTCPACLAMDGTLHDLDQEMGSHPNCRCVPVPYTRDWSEILGPLGIDTSKIPDTRPNIQTGSDWLAKQDEAVQRQVLGNKYEGWKNGTFTLQDIVKRTFDKDWGPSIQVRPVKELVK